MTKNVGARLEHHDGHDRVTKNIRDVRARSEQGQNIVTVTENVGAGSEKSRSNVTVTKNIGAGQSRVGARLVQNMIHDTGAAIAFYSQDDKREKSKKHTLSEQKRWV